MMAEKEYIEREAAIKELCQVSAPTPSESYIVEKCIGKIDNMPAADVIKSRELYDLLYIIRTNMTSITRYIRHKRDEHPTLTDGQFIDRHLEYRKLTDVAVDNILKYINEKY